MKNVADDLLIRKYPYEKLIANLSPVELLQIPLPELTAENKEELDSLRGQDESIEPSTFNFDITKTEGGFEY